MHVSKRSLGEGYIVGTGVVLAVVLVGQLLRSEPGAALWSLAWSVPVVVLVGAAFWLQRLDLTSEQIWTVAECSSLGLGIGTLVLFGVEIGTPAAPLSTTGSVLLGTTLSTMAVAGAFAGVTCSVHQAKLDLRRQNAVLNRVLRHNLRNDMTVVMCMLDDIDAATDQAHEETIDRAKEKIESLVRLTDKVRRASGPPTGNRDPTEPVDLAGLVERRVSELDETYPDVTIETALPGEALAYVDHSFGLVVDNIVESARSTDAAPDLEIAVETGASTVNLCVEDRSQTIPQADLAAVAGGSETALEHGLGVELWLVEWLVDANNGDVTFDADGEVRRITVEVDRASDRWLQ